MLYLFLILHEYYIIDYIIYYFVIFYYYYYLIILLLSYILICLRNVFKIQRTNRIVNEIRHFGKFLNINTDNIITVTDAKIVS